MVALYPRVSTQEQALNGYSIDEQTERLKNYCKAMGWDAYKVYTDAGYSGGTTDRPALQRMIADIKAGKIDKVIVYKLDRLSRSQLDTLYLIEKVFLANGCDFVSISENFDTATPFGRAMIGILAVFAQLEREQIKERMKMGKLARAKLGKFHGSSYVPIGYDYVNGELVTNEYEKMQVIEIFNMFVSGIATPTITNRMNEKNYTHKHGKWVPSTVRSILTKKTYCGYSFYNGEWYKGTHEAFIPLETYEAVQSIFERKAKTNISQRKATSLLGGLIWCGCCGGKYFRVTYKSKNNVYLKYKCSSQTRKNGYYIKDLNCKNKTWVLSELDDIVINEIKKLALDTNYIYETQDKTDNRPAIKAKIDNLNKTISKLIDLYTVESMPIDVIESKIKDAETQKSTLETELQRLDKEWEDKKINADKIDVIKSFSDIMDSGTFEQKRNAIKSLIDRIEINGDDVSIYWSFN